MQPAQDLVPITSGQLPYMEPEQSGAECRCTGRGADKGSYGNPWGRGVTRGIFREAGQRRRKAALILPS